MNRSSFIMAKIFSSNQLAYAAILLLTLGVFNVIGEDSTNGRYDVDESDLFPQKEKEVEYQGYNDLIDNLAAKRRQEARLKNLLATMKSRNELEIEGDFNTMLSPPVTSPTNMMPTIMKSEEKPIWKVSESKKQQDAPKKLTPTADVESIEKKVSLISLNNPEYRMVGPNKSVEVLMGDDVASKLFVALDNMQEEAKELFGQVSHTVDNQWTQLKTMIERQLEQSKSTASRLTSNFQDNEGLASADADADAGSTTDKPKNFLNNIGINNETQKKAGEFISNAGTSIKEVAQKDIPEAYEKAKSVVNETVTKDIPNIWNKWFGSNKTN